VPELCWQTEKVLPCQHLSEARQAVSGQLPSLVRRIDFLIEKTRDAEGAIGLYRPETSGKPGEASLRVP
jgi:hypothetical protein